MLPPPSLTRLVTIIAHVDHGKTTLADNLVESNGIISERLAGTLRYLDSDAEEQRRGITMRASAIGLKHLYVPPRGGSGGGSGGGGSGCGNGPSPPGKRGATGGASECGAGGKSVNNLPLIPTPFVVHLVDSPGHVDFSAEVTSSLLLCDGAMLVVDAVEGMCARTHSLLREAHAHQLVPVLVVNKVDRLCIDLCLSPAEAYVRLRELIESVNAASASMLNSARAEAKVGAKPVGGCDANGSGGGGSGGDDDEDERNESTWNFDPVKGNVVFASALHGWGFTVPSLSRSLFRSKTLPIKPAALKQCLFGDYKYNAETKKVLKWKPSQQGGGGGSGEPMFAEFALAPLWEVYEAVSAAAASLGLASELFADGRNASAATNGHNGSSGGGMGKKREHAKIRAESPGMDRVLSALASGATSRLSGDDDGDPHLRRAPRTAEDLGRILSRTGASSEGSIASAVLRRYRPLSGAVLDAVCEHCPSPARAASEYRTRALALKVPAVGGGEGSSSAATSTVEEEGMDGCDKGMGEFRSIQEAVRMCNASQDVPTVAHVCNFASTDRSSVTDPDLPAPTAGDASSSTTMLMGIARVLSGTLRTEDAEYYTFGPRYGGGTCLNRRRIRVYLLMGSSFVKVNAVPAGHICAIYNLESLQLKTVTLCDRRGGMPLRGFDFHLQPLVMVNVEPVSASDTEILERGLMKLSLADAAVEVTATAKGERLLACLGEIHLENSILDLKKVYCGNNIKLRISDPITTFCECTEWFQKEIEGDFEQVLDNPGPSPRQATIPPYCYEEGLGYANGGRCRAVLSGRSAAIGVRAIPLPKSVYECLRDKRIAEGSEEDLCLVGKALQCGRDETSLDARTVFEALSETLCAIDGNGNALFESKGVSAGGCVKAVKALNGEIYIPAKADEAASDGKGKDGGEHEGEDEYQTVRRNMHGGLCACGIRIDGDDGADSVALEIWRRDMRGSALAGFHLAMRAGPICEEPVWGVAVVLESVEIAVRSAAAARKDENKQYEEGGNSFSAEGASKTRQYRSAHGITGGVVVAALRSGIRCALITRPSRLGEGHLRLTLHSSLAGLGPLHAVLSKRRGKVETDTMVEGTDLIRITATIPQAESFGLAPELLKKSSGEVTAPELVFSHWEILDEDPFWIPTTEEEREDYGEILMNGDLSTGLGNNALKYIRMVRSRKGLLVDSSKIVVAAEKQRTLSRKK